MSSILKKTPAVFKTVLLSASFLAGGAMMTPAALAEEGQGKKTEEVLELARLQTTNQGVEDQAGDATEEAASQVETLVEEAEAPGSDSGDRIVVTGSRIKRAGFDTLQPGSVITDEFLKERGFENLADALNQGVSFGDTQDQYGGQSGFSVAQNFVDYLDLGSQRTLTLVNGRRFVSSNPITLFSGANPGGQVDLNVIPTPLIDRTEIIATGGAPIYGADAIAGTVNILFKQDFEGAEFNYQHGFTEEGDGQEHNFSALLGKNFAGGRGNVTFAAQYQKTDGITDADRDYLLHGWSAQRPVGKPSIRQLQYDFRYTDNTYGGLILKTPYYDPDGEDAFVNSAGEKVSLHFDQAGNAVPFNPGKPTGGDYIGLGGDGQNVSDSSVIKSPQTRFLLAGNAHYDITDRIRFFLEANYADTKGTEERNQPFYNSPSFGSRGVSSPLKFNINNPFLTAQARQALADAGVTGDFYLGRASRDITNNSPDETKVKLWRVAGGFEGDFDLLDRTFDWNISYLTGHSESNSHRRNIIQKRFEYALDAVRDPATGNIVCAATLANPGSTDPAIRDCQPLNLFGEGSPSQEAKDYMLTNFNAKATNEQSVISANISGEIFQLPAGGFAVGLGYEHRREKSSFRPNQAYQDGIGRSVPIGANSGKYNTNEFYGEFFAPIISPEMDFNFLHSFSLEGAYRYVKHSTAGGDSTYTIGARLSPVQDVEFRGNYTRAIRAPALTELYLPRSSVFNRASDPCDPTYIDRGEHAATRRKNCTAAGVPQDFQSIIVNATQRGTTGGNAELKNEKSDAWTVGFVLRPHWVEGLTFSFDYINLDLEDAISDLSVTEAMESCYDNEEFPNQYCNLFTRDADFQVTGFNTGYVNAGYVKKEIILMKLDYQFDLADALNRKADYGRVTISGSLANLLNDDSSKTGIDISDDEGLDDHPNWKGQLNLGWARGPLTLFWQTRYRGGGKISKTARFGSYLDSNGKPFNEMDPYWLFNFGATYTIRDRFTIRLNIDNVFNSRPLHPVDDYFGTYGVSGEIGRSYRIGLGMKF